jgi:sugar fermentation stimulation protein A
LKKKTPHHDLTNGIPWPALVPGTLVRRYKRFLADVRLDDGRPVTAHCPNSGSMKACADPGRPVYLSLHDNPKRKLKYTWEMIRMPDSLVGVNTLVPNRLVNAAIAQGVIPELSGYDTIQAEVTIGKGSRLDLVLGKEAQAACYIEIKNCTLVADGVAAFPDAVTQRGLKHLVALQELAEKGHRAVIFYLVQRMDARRFKTADHIDPAYGRELRRAVGNGVEILVYDTILDMEKIMIGKKLPHAL